MLFNEVASVKDGNKNIELVLKTLRTRVARLVSEIGVNLPSILNQLQITVQNEEDFDDVALDNNFNLDEEDLVNPPSDSP